jgi:uroporphyrinogen decarboxylase
MATMTKRQRLETTFAGQKVDRPAVALWRHWPGDDHSGEDLARATLEFQRTYDFDFIKITPNSDYCLSGYGAESRWEGNPEGSYGWGRRVIQTPEDWLRLRPLNPHTGLLGEVLKCNRLIGQAVGSDVPFIQTIFNPLSQAKNLAGEKLLYFLRRYPDTLKTGLAAITESILRLIESLKSTGAAGIFLAVQHATYDLMTEAEYRDFCRPLDLKILEATEGMWFRLVHVHGLNVMFNVLADYPVEVINWHDVETPPSLVEAAPRTDKTLCGGLRQWETMVYGGPAEIQAEAKAAFEATGGRRFILGTGCVTPVIAPTRNILTARKAVESGFTAQAS